MTATTEESGRRTDSERAADGGGGGAVRQTAQMQYGLNGVERTDDGLMARPIDDPLSLSHQQGISSAAELSSYSMSTFR